MLHHTGNAGLSIIVMASMLMLAACGSTPQSSQVFEAPVYPPPPETPRFIFEMSLVNSVQSKIESESDRLKRILTGASETGKTFAKPFDVSSCNGRVYVSDTVRRIVMVFDFPGSNYFEIGDKEPGELVKPLGINTDNDCNVYVVDGSTRRIVKYDQTGQFIAAYGGSNWFDRISHVAVDPDGSRIYAVDTGGVESRHHRIRVFDVLSTRHLYDIGSRGTGDGELNLPRDIEVGPDGNIYVIDGGNFRVVVFKPDGTFVRSFGKAGRHFGQFSRPKGIAIDRQGNVYVADAAFSNFQIFTPDGKLLLFIGGRSNKNAAGKYLLTAGIDVDEDGRIYFVGQFFRKVDVFRPYGLKENEGYLGTRFSQAK